MLLFWMRLALAWGCTLREAQAKCDAEEFAYWLAFYNLDPWGEQRADVRSAMVCATGMVGKTRRPIRIEDYIARPMPKPKPEGRALWAKIKVGLTALNSTAKNG